MIKVIWTLFGQPQQGQWLHDCRPTDGLNAASVFDQQERAKPFLILTFLVRKEPFLILTFLDPPPPPPLPSTGQYENLQMSDVGLASPYSETDHHGNNSLANSGKHDSGAALACRTGPSLFGLVSTSFCCAGRNPKRMAEKKKSAKGSQLKSNGNGKHGKTKTDP